MFSAYSNINAHKNYLGRPEVTKGTIESVGDEYRAPNDQADQVLN